MKELYNISIVLSGGRLEPHIHKGEDLERFKRELNKNIGCYDTTINALANLEQDFRQAIKKFIKGYEQALINKNSRS